MCLTIPKKVVGAGEGTALVEGLDGARQEVKTIVKLEIGDYCLTQQNVAVEKMSEEEALEVLKILKDGAV